MMITRRAIIMGIMTAVYASPVLSQAPPGNTVVFFNPYGNDIIVELSSDRNRWVEKTLTAGTTTAVRMDVSRVLIRILTEDRQWEGEVAGEARYVILYDEAARVYTVQERQR